IVHDDTSRRRFLSQAVMGFGLLFGIGTLGFRFVQFLIPTKKDRQMQSVLIGSESRIPADEALPMDVEGQKILVLRTDEGVAAFSRRCTDLGCLVSWNKQRRQFICPCHQGTFDKQGRNVGGPPPRPLDRLEIIRRGDQLYVNIQIT
ncbi:MAG TPA: ubiquinol-cytochrome c reductase iron-sulfur subunit, partial [Nitrospira sp.]|nr:ubiquinol-cytochrome c reductase iron-sulfur subunit [Nitrospira sp.]